MPDSPDFLAAVVEALRARALPAESMMTGHKSLLLASAIKSESRCSKSLAMRLHGVMS
jgi:hypothetical protein